MTEEEAKAKWCPYLQVAIAMRGPSHNMASEKVEIIDNRSERQRPFCIGSACMVWRWVEKPIPKDPAQAWREGYCGLAGKP